MKKGHRRRMSLGVGYIGAGNKSSVYSRKPKEAFGKIKSIYGNELEKTISKRKENTHVYKKITEEERLIIRAKVKKQLRKERIKDSLLVLFSVLLILWILYTFLYN